MHNMENEPLYIPPNKKVKGLTIYCYLCKTNITDGICKKTGKSIKFCPNGNKHAFKIYIHVPGTKNERKTKTLETRDINEAIKQAIDFGKEVKENSLGIKANGNAKSFIAKKDIQKQATPYLLIHALARYIGWLHNEGVPEHRIKVRSDDHIKDIERSFKVLAECLKNNGYNLSTLSIDDINDDVVGQIYSHLKIKGFANRTFNKYLSYYTSFLKWYPDEYNHPVKNWFESVERKKINPNPEAISRDEYQELLKQITPENGIKEYENGVKHKRNVYRPWLANGIKLGLETGRRREELINLKWNNINDSEGIKYIKVEDYKVNHIQKRNTNEEKKFIYIPVTESLQKLLNELGYEKYKNSDHYILAPELKNNRNRVMSDTLSRGFTHYYDQLNTGRKLTFKSLRKAYITNLEIFMGGGNTKAITGHSDNQVIERNYIDKKEMAKAARGFNVFSSEEDRNDNLKEIRTSTKEKTQEKNLEV